MKFAEDYLVFAISLLFPIAAGVFFACRGGQITTNEFLLANKKLRSWLVALSLVASYFSSLLLLSTTNEVFTHGAQFIILAILSYWIVAGVAHVLFIPMFHRIKITSVNEYLEARFSSGVRYVGATLFTVTYILYLCAVLYVPSQAISMVTGVPLAAGIVSTGVVCTLYTTLGGLKAVAWTNAFHLILILTALITLCIVGTNDAGGFARVIEVNKNGARKTIFNFNPDPTIQYTFWTLSIGGALTAMPVWTVSQTAVQRYMSVKMVSLARRAIWMSVPMVMIMTALTCIIGLVMYAVYANADLSTAREIQLSNTVLFYFVTDKLGHIKGLPGFITACIFAGSLSFISSGLSSLCLVIVEDFVKRLLRKISDFDSTKTCKFTTVILGSALIGGAFTLHHCGRTVLAVFSGLLYITGGTFLGLFTLGMLIPRANSRGAYFGVASSLAMTIWLFTGAQLYPSYPSGPVLISESASNGFNKTEATLHNDTEIHDNPMARFYSMSYLWYCAIGWAVTMVIGTVTSLLFETSKEKKTKVDPKLVFPLKLWLLSWLPRERKRWNSATGLPQSDDKEDWVQLGERKQPGSPEELPRDSWRKSAV